MKKVFFRIIVAVVVAFILSKMRLLGIIQVNALETYYYQANDFCVYLSENNQLCDTNLINMNLYGRTWKGYDYNGNFSFDEITFGFPSANLQNKKSILSFAVYISYIDTADSSFPMRAYFWNNSNVVSCEVSGTFNMPNEINSKVFTISCPNYVQPGTASRIFLAGPFFNRGGSSFTRFAISNISAIIDNDLLLAQNQANIYLNDIRNSILSNQNTLNDIKNNTKETNDILKDDSSVSNDKITDITNIDTNTSNTPVSDFITLPITLLNKYNTSMNISCNSINLGSLLGTDLIIPCINLEQRFGSNLWSIIDKLFSFFMVFNIAMFCVSIFERLTSLHDDFYSAYEPQHAYNGKHGGVS